VAFLDTILVMIFLIKFNQTQIFYKMKLYLEIIFPAHYVANY